MDPLVSRLRNDDIALKFDQAVMEINILTKQLENLKKDYGELLLSNSEAQNQLALIGNECQNLRANLATANEEVRRLKGQFEEKIRVLSGEVKILKKQNNHLTKENGGLEATNAKIEAELRDVRLHCESLKRKNMKLEEEMGETKKREKKLVGKLNEAEKDRAENSRLSMQNSKLERDYNAIKAAATDRYRNLEKRLSELELVVAILNENAFTSGSQLIDTTEIIQEQDSFGPEVEGLVGGQSGHEATPDEERTASSMSSPKAVSATHIKGQPESSESDTRPAEPVGLRPETLAAEAKSTCVPVVCKSPSAPPTIVDLSSDDDGELPSPRGLKRKIPLLGLSKREDDSCSSKFRLLEPKDLTHGSLKKNWEYEADLFNDLVKDTELCMKGICALHRQQQFMLHAYRATTLVKFLTDGNTKGEMKRTLADLDKYDPKGVDDCRRIVMAHCKQLFNIYKNGNDPFFAPNKIFC